jgi:hypothetical protein
VTRNKRIKRARREMAKLAPQRIVVRPEEHVAMTDQPPPKRMPPVKWGDLGLNLAPHDLPDPARYMRSRGA